MISSHSLLSLSSGERKLDFLREETLASLFRETASRFPEKTALRFNNKELTYRELDQWSDEISFDLQKKGVNSTSFVGVWLQRGLALHATILGIVKSGAAYVPLDREMPRERVEIVLQEVQASLCFSDDPLSFSGTLIPSPYFDPLKKTLHLKLSPSPADIAYVLYTSGTTGKPKGIPIQHRQIAHFIRSENSHLIIESSDLIYQGFSVSFDMWCEETWIAYLVGATLLVADELTVKSFDELSPLLITHQVTVLHAVPSLLAVITPPIPSLRIINAGGEACSESVFERWCAPSLRFYNTYGPTETTVSASIQLLQKGRPITIGKPLPNYGMAIVNELMQPVPLGQRGELVISGIGVSKGYLHRPELSVDRFISKPPSLETLPGSSIYKTGDGAQMTEQGEILFTGRLDDQIKIRGYRVELSEIESALSQIPTILSASVVAAPSLNGSHRLFGFIVLNETDPFTESSYREELRKVLPPYMVPERIIPLQLLPRLPSGKIDRKKLITDFIPQENNFQEEPHSTTGKSIEERMISTLAQIFPNQSIDLSQDFFDDLGGHSLLAAIFVSRLRTHEKLPDASIKAVYLHRPLSTLAQHWSTTSPVHSHNSIFETVLPRRYLLCGIAQTALLPAVFGLYAMQIFCPYLAYYYALQETASHHSAILVTILMFCLMSPFLLLINGIASRLLLNNIQVGDYPLWGIVYLRWWLAQTIQRTSVLEQLQGTPLYALYLRLIGMKIDTNVTIDSIHYGIPHLIHIGSQACIGSDVLLQNAWVEKGLFKVRSIRIENEAIIGSRCILSGGSQVQSKAQLKGMGFLSSSTLLPRGEIWEGSPAQKMEPQETPSPVAPLEISTGRRLCFSFIFIVLLVLFPLFLILPMTPTLITVTMMDEAAPDYNFSYLTHSPLFAFSYVILFLIQSVIFIRIIQNTIPPGTYSLFSMAYVRKWFSDHIWRLSLFVLHPIYATVFIGPVLRLLGAKIGKNTEISTASNITPHLLEIGNNAFIADTVNLGEMEIQGQRIVLEKTIIGDSSFVGNGALIPQGAQIPSGILIGVLSSPPSPEVFAKNTAKDWFGIPSIPMPRRQINDQFQTHQTLDPSTPIRLTRGIIEFIRILLPMSVVISLSTLFVAYAHDLIHDEPLLFALIQIPFYFLGIIALPALGITVLLKWIVVGRYRTANFPLWSWAVWRSEAITVIYESLAVPYFLQFLRGTPLLPFFLKLLGVKTGKRIWMNTTDITEFDLVSLGNDCALNEDSGPQTHLFEDRVMKMGPVDIQERSTIGSRSVILYGSTIGSDVLIEPQSLVMKGEFLPPGTHWSGSPTSRL